MKKYTIIYLLFLFLFLLSFTSAGFFPSSSSKTQINVYAEQGLDVTYPKFNYIQNNYSFDLFIHVYNKSTGKDISKDVDFCTLHLYDINGTHTLLQNLTYNSSYGDLYLHIDGKNFTNFGTHAFNIYCESNEIGGFANGIFDITLSGIEPDDPWSNAILLIFFSMLFIGIIYLNRNTNYEKWYNNILKRYEHKNFIKVTFSLIGYNLMKHTFIIYYLLGFPVILTLLNIAYTYNILILYNTIKVFTYLYTIAFIFIGITFLSYIQEFVVMILEDIENMNWGFENG